MTPSLWVKTRAADVKTGTSARPVAVGGEPGRTVAHMEASTRRESRKRKKAFQKEMRTNSTTTLLG